MDTINPKRVILNITNFFINQLYYMVSWHQKET